MEPFSDLFSSSIYLKGNALPCARRHGIFLPHQPDMKLYLCVGYPLLCKKTTPKLSDLKTFILLLLLMLWAGWPQLGSGAGSSSLVCLQGEEGWGCCHQEFV